MEQQLTAAILHAREPATRGKPPARPRRRRRGGVVVGLIESLDANGNPLVRLPNSGGTRPPVAARSVVEVGEGDVGREAVLTYGRRGRRDPIVLGVVRDPRAPALRVKGDGHTLELTADREIVLRCGRASITLTRAGKVLIRGAYILSRSSGSNRIKGGSVQIN